MDASKTCLNCSNRCSEEAAACLRCGHQFGEAAQVEVGHLDFLLKELTDWQRRGLVRAEEVHRLTVEYRGRRERLTGRPMPAWTEPKAAPPRTDAARAPAEHFDLDEFAVSEPRAEEGQPTVPEPSRPTASAQRAWDLVRAGRYDAAVGFCFQALKGEPRNAELLNARSEAYERLGKLRAGLADAQHAHHLDRENVSYRLRAERLAKAVARQEETPQPPPLVHQRPLVPPPVSEPVRRAESPPPAVRQAPAPEPHRKPPTPPAAPPPRQPEPQFDWIGWLNAFLEEYNIQRGWVIVGILLLGGFAGLAQQTWSTTGKYILYFGLLGLTTLFYFGGRKMVGLGPGWRTSGISAMLIGLLLLPVDVLALHDTLGLPGDVLGLIASVVALAAYAVTTARMRLEWFAYLTGTACLSSLYFALRLLSVPPECYGLFTMPLAFASLMFGWRLQQREDAIFAMPLVRMAHVVTGVTLATMLVNWRLFAEGWVFHAVGVVAMGAAVYVAGAYLFEETPSVYLSAGLLVGAAFLLLHGFSPDAAWQHFRLLALLVGGALFGAGVLGRESLRRENLSEGYSVSGHVVTGLVVVAIAGEALMSLSSGVSFVPSPALVSTLVVCLLAATLYAVMAHLFHQPALLYVSGGLACYTVLPAMGQMGVHHEWWSIGLTAAAWGLSGVAWWLTHRSSAPKPASPEPEACTPQSEVRDPKSGIANRKSEIANLKSPFSLPLLHWAYIVALAGALLAVGLRVAAGNQLDMTVAAVVTLALQCGLYAVSAWRDDEPRWLHAAAACGVLAFVFATSLVEAFGVQAPEALEFALLPNYGWRLCPVTAVALLLVWRLRVTGRQRFATPLAQWAVGVGVVGLASLSVYYVQGGYHLSVAAGFYAYALLAVVASLLFRDDVIWEGVYALPSVLMYVTAALLALAQFCLCDYFAVGWAKTAFLAVLLALGCFVVALALRPRDAEQLWIRPLSDSAQTLALIAGLIGFGHYYWTTGFRLPSAASTPEAWLTLATALIALLIAAGDAAVRREPALVYVAALYALAGYATALHLMPDLIAAAERNYGLLFAPCVAGLLATAAVLELLRRRPAEGDPGSGQVSDRPGTPDRRSRDDGEPKGVRGDLSVGSAAGWPEAGTPDPRRAGLATAAVLELRRRRPAEGDPRPNLALPSALVAAVVGTIALAWQLPYTLDGLRPSVLTALLSYTALVVAAALFMRAPALLYGAAFTFAWAATHVGIWREQPTPIIGLVQAVLAWVYLALAVGVTGRQRPAWSTPLSQSALVLGAVATLVSPWGLDEPTLWASALTPVLVVALYCLETVRLDTSDLGLCSVLFLVPVYARAAVSGHGLEPWLLAPAPVAALVYFCMACLRRDRWFTWLSVASFSWGFTHFGLWREWSMPVLGLAQALLAWLYVGLGAVLPDRDRSEWTSPLPQGALVLAGIATVVSVTTVPAGLLWASAVTAILMTGLFCLQSVRLGEEGLGNCSALFLIPFYYFVVSAGGEVDLWALLPALAAAALYFATGHLTGRRSFTWLSIAALWFGGLLSLWASGVPLLVAVTILVAAGGIAYAWQAERWQCRWLAGASAITLGVAVTAGLSAAGADDRATSVVGLVFTVAVALGGAPFATLSAPFRYVASAASLVVMRIAFGVSTQFAAGMMGAYAVLYLAAAWCWRETFYAYAGPAAATVALWVHCAERGYPVQDASLYFALLGLLWAGLCLALDRAEAWEPLPEALSQAALGTASLTAVTAFLGGLADSSDTFGTYALVVDALAFSLVWYRLRQEALLHVGYFCVVAAYYLPLLRGGVRVLDAYAIPIGLYLLAVGVVGQRTGRIANPQGLFTVGLLTTLLSTFTAALPSERLLHQVLLMTFSVAAVAVGISQRYRTFVLQGSGFLLAFVFYKVSGIMPEVRVHWAFYAIGLAIALAAALLAFNAKREQIIRTMELVREEWGRWQ